MLGLIGLVSKGTTVLDYVSQRLANACNAFHAEINAIIAACIVIYDCNMCDNIGVLIDTQAAFLSLNLYTTTSLLVRLCKTDLSGYCYLYDITLAWVSEMLCSN